MSALRKLKCCFIFRISYYRNPFPLLFSLRMQFLESLETWKIEAMERANSVVAAKVTVVYENGES